MCRGGGAIASSRGPRVRSSSPQRSISVARNFCTSAGGALSTGMMPSRPISALISGVAATAFSSAAAGRRSASASPPARNHRPADRVEARHAGLGDGRHIGAAPARGWSSVTPSARTLPALICASTLPASANIFATWPPITSFSAGGSPRSATPCSLCRPWSGTVPARWIAGARPAMPRSDLAGLRLGERDQLRRPISPARSGLTTSASGVRKISDTACKSRSVSNGSFLASLGLAASDSPARAGCGRRAGFGDHVGRDRCRRRRRVLDHHRLAQPLLQLRRHRARERVDGAARRERHHKIDRPGRKVLRPGRGPLQ